MKIDTLPIFIVLILATLFVSCTKETRSVREIPEVRTYTLRSNTGEPAGIFTIGSDGNGISLVTIELDKKSHLHGQVYKASICDPRTGNCYARLSDVNAVIGYGETSGITEEASGRRLGAAELFGKTGYRVQISDDNGPIASGTIQ